MVLLVGTQGKCNNHDDYNYTLPKNVLQFLLIFAHNPHLVQQFFQGMTTTLQHSTPIPLVTVHLFSKKYL